ncbi:hypothetical protein Neosp_002934 [[Neocosmospora] mangrovei]
MRLLNTKHIELEYFADSVPQYAILSHTWEEEEVTFQDMEQDRVKHKKGYAKLIAPQRMVFFNKVWQRLGTKASLGDKISECTGVPQAILSGTISLESASVAQRMSWAAGRKTTRLEDRAYSLMGIFDINMPLLYGEGHKAFIRLQEEVMRVSDDHSIFAWRHTDTRSGGGLLAETPDAFKDSKNIVSWNPFTPYNSPFTMTNKGVHLDAPFIAQADGGLGLVVLHCAEARSKDRLVGIYLRDPFLTMEHFERCRSDEFTLVNLRQFSPFQYPTRNLCIRLQGMASSQTQGGAVSKNQELQPRHPIEGEQTPVIDGVGHAANDEQEKEPQRRLSLAASGGKEAVVKELLALPNINADSVNEENRTPLSLAAEAGHEHIVDLLLNRREVDINSRDKHGLSPLSYAAALGHEKVVWILLARSDIIPGSQDVRERKIVSLAARRGHKNLVRQLLARKDTQGHLIDGRGRSVLSHAAERGQDEVVRLVLGSGKVHPDLKDQDGRSALWYASTYGHTEMVKLLLKTGWVDPTSKDDGNSTTVCQASANGHRDVVKELLDCNADVNSGRKDGATALWHATTRGDNCIVKMLLESGADPNVRGPDRQMGLWHACQKGYDAIVRLLLTKGADPDAVDDMPVIQDPWVNLKKTPPTTESRVQPALWHAASRGYHIIVQLLLENDATLLDRSGNFIGLDEAAKSGHEAVIKVYLQKCTRDQRWDDHISSALIWAIYGKQAASVEILIKSLENVRKVLRTTHAYWLLQPGRAMQILVNSLENVYTDIFITRVYWLLQPALLGDEATTRLLLDNGADVNESFDGTDTLPYAAKHRCLTVANMMVGTWGEKVTQTWNGEMGWYNNGLGDYESMKNMVLNMTAEGYSPNALWCAVVQGDEALVEVLLQHGADTEMKIKEGKTVLFYARSLGHDSIVRLLFKHGAKDESKLRR